MGGTVPSRSVYPLAFAEQKRYDYTMEIYVSPHTGKQYSVVAVPQSRTDYHVHGDGSTRYERQYVEYQFYSEGKKVTWTYNLDPKYLSDTFGEIEGIYAPWETSSWD